MVRYDEITRKMISISLEDIKKMNCGDEISVQIEEKYYYIRIG